ncbi:hypothetical protein MOX02_03400 [Methylobacterium oxalidis]|uniref:Uncharacterized protein n=1 Tax=Methylobacterium oxalidis TaxID=944322 RepID=A0A512IX65_9HYPH|nr:hypothetical protein MOX02_03400 [Methylobacterium oxalidis]GLS67681.1 hypothetical protein GCM10007888_60660 [Methylobacterium oxalidis]
MRVIFRSYGRVTANPQTFKFERRLATSDPAVSQKLSLASAVPRPASERCVGERSGTAAQPAASLSRLSQQ